jgi:hypothetical protein
MTEQEHMRSQGWTYREIADESDMTVKDVKQCFAQLLEEEQFDNI